MALVVAPGIPASAQETEADAELFFQELAAYGRWLEHPQWGSVWRPNVDTDWRPYTRGHWVFTEENGWYWVAEEPFGWATFHYGRWVLDPTDGWLWIPGEEWGPAWVAWRASDDHVGWAPLPPDADWGADDALLYDETFYDNPGYQSAWVFVRAQHMTTSALYRLATPQQQNAYMLRRTAKMPGFKRFDRRIVNVGFDVRRLEQITGRPVPRVHLRLVDNPRDHSLRRAPGATDIAVFRPRITQRPDGPRLRAPSTLGPGPRPPIPPAGGPATPEVKKKTLTKTPQPHSKPPVRTKSPQIDKAPVKKVERKKDKKEERKRPPAQPDKK